MQGRCWQLLISALISFGILVLALINHHKIIEAFGILKQARPMWLIVALIITILGYIISSQVFRIVLRSLGYRLGALRLWATTLVAIVISQSVPAGGLGSYAFLVGKFNRHGVPSGQAALIASLEALSYVTAMLMIFSFSLLYLTTHRIVTGESSYLAALVAVLVIGGAVFVLSRSVPTLTGWLLSIKNALARVFRSSWGDEWVHRVVGELARGRSLVAGRRRDVALLIGIQLTALSFHSLAMLVVLYSLGVSVSFLIVLTAFGIALITSTFNVLPGGGGTVEVALVAVLVKLGTGEAALPAAIIFRLLNFWLFAPVAAVCYHWLMHETPTLVVPTAITDLSTNTE
ncbi:MAG: flippase-like domain-containing protein [Chloroflexales bacterium]|nr:flippase-like domain-containing protein [Chloroflexales bacterium]